MPISRRARKLVSNSLPINASLHSSNEDSEVVINSTILFKVFLSYVFLQTGAAFGFVIFPSGKKERKKNKLGPCPVPLW